MKKILIPILIFLCTLPALSQTGTGWVPYRTKANFRDSTYHYRDANFNGTLRVREGYVRIGAVTVTANGSELNILDGALVSTTELNRLVGVTSGVQAQLNSKAPLSNPNFTTAVRLAGDTILPKARLSQIIASQIRDSMLARLNAARDISSLVLRPSDTLTTVATKGDIANLSGGGGESNKYKLQFIVGQSGYPGNGDSTITHTTWIGKEIEVHKGSSGYLRYNNGSVNSYPGFRLNNTTGEITVRPAFSTGEQVSINAYDPMNVTWLTLSGTESSLLTSIRAYYKLNESAGTAVNDEVANYDGVTNGTVGVVGHSGYAEQFDGVNDYVNLGSDVGDVGTNSFSITAWISPTVYPTGYNIAGIFGNWGEAAPYFYIAVDATQNLIGVINFGSGNIEILSNADVTLSTMTHIALVADRSGLLTMYVNGVAQTQTANISGSSAISITNNNISAIGQIGSTYSGYNFTGTIDEVGLWPKALSQGEVTEAMNETYPFQ